MSSSENISILLLQLLISSLVFVDRFLFVVFASRRTTVLVQQRKRHYVEKAGDDRPCDEPHIGVRNSRENLIAVRDYVNLTLVIPIKSMFRDRIHM
jgi:hypothetical protein